MILTASRLPLRVLAALCALAFVVTACRSGESGDDGLNEAARLQRAAAQVRPPSSPDAALTARAGIIVGTASRSWERLLQARPGEGVVVLYTQPGGPSDEVGLQRGDLITAVDGERVTNQERAVVLLRARPGARKTVEVTRRDGSQERLVLRPVEPGQVDLRSVYTQLIQAEAGDPVLYFLRGQIEGASYEEALADAERAIELVPSFVEAINLRAQLRWNLSTDPGLPTEQVEQLRDAATQDWSLAKRLDPRHPQVMASISQAQSMRGNAASARREAEQAIEADPQFPGGHNALAVANLFLGRYAEAAEPARTAVDLHPYNATYYRTLGLVFLRLERRDDCVQTIEAIGRLVDDPAARAELLRTCDAGAQPVP